jgi:hypothetical protein
MYLGKTLFAQLMDFLPWKTFRRIIDRCDGDRYVKSQIWITVSVYVLVAIVKKAPQSGGVALHFATGFFAHLIRENAHTTSLCAQ